VCGIAGFLDTRRQFDASAASALVADMADCLVHRGPDDSGAWVDTRVGLAFAQRRLAVVDLSDDGHQPMAAAHGGSVINLNGEIYNHRELRRQLESDGVRFRGTCDTEVLVEALARWGVNRTLARVNGMFAFAYWDAQRRELVLARDRLGEKPLYVGWAGPALLFASELKALRRHPAFRGDLDVDAVSEYLRWGYVPSPLSIYQGIGKLPPGHVVRIPVDDARPGQIRSTPYWSLTDIAARGLADPLPADAPVVSLVEELLTDAVGLRMTADVPVGAFLSGGVDSSLVVALMQAQASRPVRTFTIGFSEKGYDEAPYAADVARHLGTEHTEVYASPRDALDVVPLLPAMFDEPFADSSQVPTYLLAALTRAHVTVSLSGDGGDEVFGGYARYRFAAGPAAVLHRLPGGARSMIAGAIRTVPPQTWNRWSDAVGSALPKAARLSRAGDKLHKLARTLDCPDTGSAYLALMSAWPDVDDVLRHATAPLAKPPPGGRHDDLMLFDQRTYLPDDILTKVDRATMAVSLEGRIPLLDHRLVELAWRLPQDAKVSGHQGKRVLRDLLAKHVPRHLTDRPKMGFGVPVGEWLRGPLREWGEELLGRDTLLAHGVLRAEPVQAVWQAHQSGAVNADQQLWTVLMLTQWLAAQNQPAARAG
jgi:asparagine synthase (glutamine-hydrolysing)